MHNKLWSILHTRPRGVFIAIMLILGLAVSAAAATITVTTTFDSGQGSLRQAIADALAGDTINFSLPANSAVTLTSGELRINKSLTIAGPGANLLTIQRPADAQQNFRIFFVYGTGNNVTISGLTISGGYAQSSDGGGILAQLVTLTIAGCRISSNLAIFDGAGVNFHGDFTDKLTITNSSISSNLAGSMGGGLYIAFGDHSQSGAVINNCTIADNTTGASGAGVVVYSSGQTSMIGVLTLSNTTITNNGAYNFRSQAFSDAGGGILNSDGIVNVTNSIIARNSAPSGSTGTDFAGALSSQGYNLIGTTSGMTIHGTTTGNQLNVDPKLDSLKDNGGPTLTCALLSASPAIDAGNSGGSTTDQRGFARPVDSPSIPNASGGDGSDIGAYEVQPDVLPGCNTINTVVNNNGDNGAGTLRGIIAGVCNGSTITFAGNVRGAINLTSGELAINKSLMINGPGANLLTLQRSSAGGTAAFRVFNIASGVITSLSDLTIANGNLTGGLDFGGGILNNGTLTLSRVTVSGNSAGIGGGISNAGGTLYLNNSTVSNNSANSGGGISGGILNSTNSTISGNTARTGNAGGITVGTVSLINTTVANNSAPGSGGGLFNNGNNGVSVRARNSIIALNSAASSPDVSGALTSDNFNLIGDGSGATITPANFADQIGSAVSPIDPLLGSLTDNGGGTPTHALLPGSSAIDKGHSSGLATDQRGFTRPVDRADIANASGGDGADIGAFEVPAPPPPPSPTPTSTPIASPTPGSTPTPTPAAVTTLANISTRLRVETDDNVLIGGFIITGTQPKKVIIRAIGTSLPLADKLVDPTLELHGPNGLIEANDNWVDSASKQAIIDSTIPPSSDLESAIVATLPANGAAYTAIVRGANGTTGIGVIEAYDLDTSADSRLANISTRGFVQTGDNVLIAGTIVVGPSSQKVLIRGIGPSLPIPGRMADPTLELRDSNGAILQSNDNWVDSPNKQAIIDTTVPPTNDFESAIIADLPGNGASYTAVLRGVNDTTGIAVVEVYALQ